MSLFFRFLTISLFSVITSLPLAAKEDENADWFAEFGEKEVAVSFSKIAGRQINLVKMVNEDISFKDGQASGSVPVKEVLTNRDIFFRVTYPGSWNAFLENTKQGKYEEALPLIRSSVYPLIKFMELPNAKLNVHELVFEYLDALVQSGYSVEAGKLVSRLPLPLLSSSFMERSERVCEQLAAKGKGKEALATAARFSYESKYHDLYPRYMSFARILRQNDFNEEAQAIYQKILSDKSAKESLRAQLWSIYADIRLGRVEIGRLGLAKIDAKSIGPGTDEYPLHLLINARLFMAGNKHDEALEAVAQSVNKCGLRDEWTAEIFHTAAECYELAERLGVARAIYSQNSLFYPSHPYGKKSKVKLDLLPVAVNKIIEEVNEDDLDATPSVGKDKKATKKGEEE